MYKWTYSEFEQKLANDEIEQLQIYDMPKKPLYHYTSREVFWLIIESESLLARHIMFSNDYQENMIGKKKIEQAMEKENVHITEIESLPFMICFCEEKDLLSQWRGYAKEGIAMEFDFLKGLYDINKVFSSYYCYTIMNHDSETKYISENVKGEKVVTKAIVSPYSVIYTENEEQVDEEITKKINQIAKAAEQSRQQYAIGMIPYIKNNKFKEEKEYRLIFDMKQLVPETQQHLLQKKYVYLDVNGIKKPNIRVKFGDQSVAEEEGTIKLYYSNESWTKILEKLRQELIKTIEIELVIVADTYKMPSDEIVVSNGKFQEKVCASLRSKMRQQTPPVQNIKIWCDGHLPIRRIIVGPSPDAELMKCSIEEYLKTKYWMRDIRVDISEIPLRN